MEATPLTAEQKAVLSTAFHYIQSITIYLKLKAVIPVVRETDAMFVSQKGGRLDRTAFFRLFQAIAAVAGLPTEKRQMALGHRSINSTMQYVGTSDSQAAGETSRA